VGYQQVILLDTRALDARLVTADEKLRAALGDSALWRRAAQNRNV
jgi:hypothetical protein